MTWTPDLLGRDRISSMGLGVVVMTARGYRPSLSAKERLSQVCSGYSHAAISSHQAASNCGPRNWSGSCEEKARAKAPLGQVSFRLEGSYQGLFQGGQAAMMPDSPSIMTNWASGRERATRATRKALPDST